MSAPQIVTALRNHSAKEEVRALLHQMAEPTTSAAIRASLPGDMTSQGTALARPTQTFTVDWTQPPTVAGTTPSSIQLQSQLGTGSPMGISSSNPFRPILPDPRTEPFVLLRDPVVAFIRRNLVPSNASFVQSGYKLRTQFPGYSQQSPASTNYYRSSFVSGPGAVVPLPFTSMDHTSGSWKCYGDSAPCGTVGDRRVFWADGADILVSSQDTITRVAPTATNDAQGWLMTLELTATSAIPATDYFVQVVQHTGETEESIVSQIAGPTTIGVASTFIKVSKTAINFSGYFSVALMFDDTATPGIAVTLHSTALNINCVSAYQHVSLSGEQQMTGLLDQIRVNGASILVSNTVNEITKGGTVYMCQTPGDRPWYHWFDTDEIANLNTELRSVQPWAKGAYTYVKPQGDAPLRLRTAYSRPGLIAESNAAQFSVPLYTPFQQSGTVIVVCVPASIPTDAPQYPTSQATVTVTRAIEFTTRGQFFNVATTRIPTSLYAEFVDAARVLPQFYENPLHLAALGAFIAKAAGMVVTWAPRIHAMVTGAREGYRAAAAASKHERDMQQLESDPNIEIVTKYPTPQVVRVARNPPLRRNNNGNRKQPTVPKPKAEAVRTTPARRSGLDMYLNSLPPKVSERANRRNSRPRGKR